MAEANWSTVRERAEREREEQEAAQRREREQVDDLTWLMGSKRGRRLVARLLEEANVDRASYNPNALQMAYNEGRRAYGITVQAWLLAGCPGLYVEMLKEQRDGRDESGHGANPK